MTTSQNPSGTPAQPGPPQQNPHDAAPGRYGPDPRRTGPQQWAGPPHAPQYGPPGRYYDGHPQVPFGGPPYGNARPGGPVPPAGTEAWPTAARRAAVPEQRGGSGPRIPDEPPRNGFGTTALVLGILGLLFSLIPFVGVIAWPLVILGLIFGVLGIVRVSRGKANNRGVAISGTVLSALGLLVCVLYVSAFASAVSEIPAAAPAASVPAVTSPVVGEGPAAPAAPVESAGGDVITYEVTGSGSAGSVTYIKDENFGQEQANGVALPWSTDVTFDGGAPAFQPLSLVAQSGSGGSDEITCRILRNGEELTSSTSSGPYAVVSCSAS
ncbi:MmpS family transport accessory protein [Pseudonocardia sp. NPDC049635]|uniref:MmpS family transport accessory protein n=1 Tax=Pseudonocardia sp. NPDC049635 TaxID=3155506 RepID=UPI00340AD59B